jgi:hypothetical protein
LTFSLSFKSFLAYASLGEEMVEHAFNAEAISKKQLVLAHLFNDPNAVTRCKLFLSFSYIQLRRFKEANFLLKFVISKFSKNSIELN